MNCRRCYSSLLIRLEKKVSKDHDVYRCQECGFLFSPGDNPEAPAARLVPAQTASRTAAIQSGYGVRG